jgi:hypothetical protein
MEDNMELLAIYSALLAIVSVGLVCIALAEGDKEYAKVLGIASLAIMPPIGRVFGWW